MYLYSMFAIFYSVFVLSQPVATDFFATLGTIAYQVPLSMESSRQEHWSG